MTEGAPQVRRATARGRWVVAATVLGSGMAFLDSTVVNVALPAIGRDLGAEVAGLQWILTGYLVTLASLILLGGALGDHYGRRRVYVIGVVWFALASALCASAQSVPWLVAARLLQGVGGGLLTPGSLAIIEASFVRSDRAAAVGTWAGLAGITTAVGPPLGGWLVDVASWRWIFLFNLPLAVAVVLISWRHVPETSDPDPPAFDPVGAVTGAVALAAGTWALIAAGDRGPTAGSVLVVGALAVVAAVVFVVVEHRSDHPMLPPSLFSSRQFTAANLVTVTVYAALGASTFLVVVHLQQVAGYTALQAGLALVPMTLLMLVLSAPSGELAQRIGPRWQMGTGPLVAAVGLALMVRIGPDGDYLTAVLPAVGVLGLGLAIAVAPLTATVLAAIDDRQAGLASGVNNVIARTAQLAAIAVVPVLAGLTGEVYRDTDAFAAGFRMAMWITAGLSTVGGVIGFVLVGTTLEGDEGPARGEVSSPAGAGRTGPGRSPRG